MLILIHDYSYYFLGGRIFYDGEIFFAKILYCMFVCVGHLSAVNVLNVNRSTRISSISWLNFVSALPHVENNVIFDKSARNYCTIFITR